jgi:AcrR family transcriptional regulator
MGTKAPSTADRRVRRTRRSLADALLALMIERGWEGFSVQDLCERAGVGRSTFYTHFADKEELVTGTLGDLRRDLRAQLAAAGAARRPLAFARGLIDHAHEQRRLFLAIMGKRGGFVVQRGFRELVLDLVREDLGGALPAGPAAEAAIPFVAGAFIELLNWSLEARRPLPPEEVDAIFHQLSEPVLAAAARRDGTGRARGDR